MKTLFSLAVLSGLLGGPCLGQDTAKVTFHVTSVRSEEATDWCTAGKCSATRITVGGYADVKGSATVEYVLECVEIIAHEPTPHMTIACLHVHAHEDYSVKIGATYISFRDDTPRSPETVPAVADYSIKSEKEIVRR